MSFLIYYKNSKISRHFQERVTPSPLWANEDNSYVFIGETWDTTPRDICNCGWEDEAERLNSFSGAFSIVSVKENRCTMASNIGGTEALYYYHDQSTFLVSDNMWDIIKIIKPAFEQLDIDNIKKMMVMGYTTLDGKTFISNLRILRPGHQVTFYLKESTVKDISFVDFKTKCQITNLSEAVETIDKALDDTMKKIKRLCGDCKYGVGISGGLDSRIIPHYALKNGLQVVGFNNCVLRPKTLLLSRSCKNARAIAKTYGIPYTEVKWKPTNLERKKKLKLEKYPMGPQNSGSDICKYETKGFPEFDVLLTGGSGAIIGSTLHKDIESMTEADITNQILDSFCRNIGNSVMSSRILRGIEFVFGIRLKSKNSHSSYLDKIVGSSVKENVKSEITEYVSTMKQKGASNFDIIYNYIVNVVSYQNRFGAYESRFGLKRSFSIYVPFLLPECLKLSPALLEDRVVLEELIRVKIPEVAAIKSESFKDSPNENRKHRFERIRRIILIVSYMLRGNGSFVDLYYYKKKAIQNSFKKDMTNENEWFYRIFPIRDDIEKFAKEDVKTFFSVWDMKQILDCLECHSYEKFH